MLADRDYMRTDPSAPMPSRPISATVMILIINGVVFLLQQAFSRNPQFEYLFALSLTGIKHGYIWELLTFQFMHASIMHILLNCWGIYVFGRAVEEALGRRTYVLLYLLSGVIGGLVQLLAALLWYQHFGGLVVGASAGLFGLVAAFATMFPNRLLSLLLFFIIPLTIRAKTLLLISGMVAALGIVFPDLLGGHIANAAHLGGMLTGILFIRQLRRHWGFWPGEQPRPRRWATKGWFKKSGSTRPSRRAPNDVIDVDEVGADEFMASQVDPILEKIHAHGIQSLSDRERKILEDAHRRIRR